MKVGPGMGADASTPFLGRHSHGLCEKKHNVVDNNGG